MLHVAMLNVLSPKT